jgi:hypothetical protein
MVVDMPSHSHEVGKDGSPRHAKATISAGADQLADFSL